ncbi:MAG: DUF3127 domain-containing protein [Leptolyngbya sp. SIO3F4]|nr:DUF3127 domain-containing protein [Leptolyngbya sp. SIO3F4]
MELNGKVKVILDEQQFDSGFRKKEFVVTTQEQYPQEIKFELVNDRIDQLNGVQAGEAVNVQFDLRGNEYKGRYYVNLRAWRIDRGQGASAPAASGMDQAPPPSVPPPSAPTSDTFTAGEDDLPF